MKPDVPALDPFSYMLWFHGKVDRRQCDPNAMGSIAVASSRQRGEGAPQGARFAPMRQVPQAQEARDKPGGSKDGQMLSLKQLLKDERFVG